MTANQQTMHRIFGYNQKVCICILQSITSSSQRRVSLPPTLTSHLGIPAEHRTASPFQSPSGGAQQKTGVYIYDVFIWINYKDN